MSLGILDVTIELLQQALLMPDGMVIHDILIDEKRNMMRLFVEHVDIPRVVPGAFFPRVNMRLRMFDREPRVMLESWDVTDG